MGQPNFTFSPEDFKRWMVQNEKDGAKKQKLNNLIGLAIESKLSAKRLAVHIKPKDGELRELVMDFKERGGTIYDVEGRNFLVEVNSGFFYIPRYFVKRVKKDDA